jgi:hypothetical protein
MVLILEFADFNIRSDDLANITNDKARIINNVFFIFFLSGGGTASHLLKIRAFPRFAGSVLPPVSADASGCHGPYA